MQRAYSTVMAPLFRQGNTKEDFFLEKQTGFVFGRVMVLLTAIKDSHAARKSFFH